MPGGGHKDHYFVKPPEGNSALFLGGQMRHIALMSAAQSQRWFLKEWRIKQGLSQEALAERTGTNMTKSEISKLELGKRRWNASQLWKLASALEIEPWWLIAVNPEDPNNDLALLEALRAVDKAKRSDAIKLLWAFSDQPRPPEPSGQKAPPRPGRPSR